MDGRGRDTDKTLFGLYDGWEWDAAAAAAAVPLRLIYGLLVGGDGRLTRDLDSRVRSLIFASPSFTA